MSRVIVQIGDRIYSIQAIFKRNNEVHMRFNFHEEHISFKQQ
jgi:hypothetical protein